MIQANRIAEVKSMYKTWNIGLIPNKINIVPGFHLLCVIRIYKTDDFFPLLVLNFFAVLFCPVLAECLCRLSTASLNFES